ncbi:MAG: peptide deformylase [Spirochaetota bacterium]|nr:MAG: peptide deformylase [Spirochaetota bacterium]
MAVKEVKKYPDPFLRKRSEEVSENDDGIKALIADMFETMDEEDGVGLAAPQIGISKRIIVISVDEKGFDRLALINPVIEYFSDDTGTMEEGCLSVPGINADVTRPTKVVVRGTTRNGRMVEISASGLLGRALQHEIDHLNGTLFIDRLNERERKRVENELEELERQYTAIMK